MILNPRKTLGTVPQPFPPQPAALQAGAACPGYRMGTQLLSLLSLFLVPFTGGRKCHGLGGILTQCPYDLGSVLTLVLGFPVCEKEGPHSS